jgi:hypothetical protein
MVAIVGLTLRVRDLRHAEREAYELFLIVRPPLFP